MTRMVFAACLLLAGLAAAPTVLSKDPVQLLIHKGARVGVINMLDPEISHFHTSKVLTQSFFKTLRVGWQMDSMLNDAVGQRLTQLELHPVPTAASETLARNRDGWFVNNSVAKGLPREVSREFAQLAATEHLDAVIVLAPGLNNPAQAGNEARRALPDYLRGWGFVTGDTNEKPSLFNMTQVLLISVTPQGSAVLNAREWGGAYTDEWADYVAPPDLKQIPLDQLDRLQPLFSKLLTRQVNRVLDWITVAP